jgi:hypothetical protein
VDVAAGVDVVEQIPADVVRVLVDYEIVFAVPAPVGAKGPIPSSDFKKEAARKPEAMVIRIEALDAIAVGRAKVFEAAMLKRVVDVVALVVGAVVAVPVIVADVGKAVDAATLMAFWFGLGVWIVAFRRRWRDAALIRARGIMFALPAMFFAALGKGWNGDEEREGNGDEQTKFHRFLLHRSQS